MSEVKKEPKATGEKGKTKNGSNAESEQQVEEVISLKLGDILLDEDYQVRPKLHERAVKKYAVFYMDYKAAMDRGETTDFPLDLIIVWYDESRGLYVLICGYHRIAAARRAGLTVMQVIVFRGTPDQAFQVALTDNTKHGEAMSNGDKKHAILKALDRYKGVKSLREIGRELGCSPSYISRLNRELFGKSTTTAENTGKQSKARKSPEVRIDDALTSLNKLWESLGVEYYDAFLDRVEKWCCCSKHIRDNANGEIHQADDVCQQSN